MRGLFVIASGERYVAVTARGVTVGNGVGRGCKPGRLNIFENIFNERKTSEIELRYGYEIGKN